MRFGASVQFKNSMATFFKLNSVILFAENKTGFFIILNSINNVVNEDYFSRKQISKCLYLIIIALIMNSFLRFPMFLTFVAHRP